MRVHRGHHQPAPPPADSSTDGSSSASDIVGSSGILVGPDKSQARHLDASIGLTSVHRGQDQEVEEGEGMGRERESGTPPTTSPVEAETVGVVVLVLLLIALLLITPYCGYKKPSKLLIKTFNTFWCSFQK